MNCCFVRVACVLVALFLFGCMVSAPIANKAVVEFGPAWLLHGKDDVDRDFVWGVDESGHTKVELVEKVTHKKDTSFVDCAFFTIEVGCCLCIVGCFVMFVVSFKEDERG